jgi:hypothetical protein
MHEILMGVGWRVNFKRVHRLWKAEHLQVPKKRRQRWRLPSGRGQITGMRFGMAP